MVRRRTVVQSLGSGLLALAGCVTSEDGNDEPEKSETAGTIVTERTTETTRAPTTSETAATTSDAPATGSEASVDDVVVYNETDEKRHVELVVTPINDSSNRFIDEFTLGPYAKDSYTDSETIPAVEQMDEECRVEVTVDGERSATYDWEGDVKDYTGLQIHVDYEEITFTRKVA